jgi:nucleoside phosphorylase
MPEDESSPPPPGLEDGRENRHESAQEQKAQKEAGAKKQNRDSLPKPKNAAESSERTAINIGNSGPFATGENSTVNTTYHAPVFQVQGSMYQGADTSQMKEAMREFWQKEAPAPENPSARRQERQRMHAVIPGRAVILTARSVEYIAVRTYLSDLEEETHKGTVYERGTFTAGGRAWDVAIAEIGMGGSIAALEAEHAIAHFEPGVILFVGTAGGIKDVRPGDVVAATKVYGYESGKVSEFGFLTRPDVGQSSYPLVQRAMAEARKEEWLRRVRDSVQGTSTAPRAFVGPIAAGEKVVASTRSDLFTFLRTTYEDVLAVEMEGRGFLEATYRNKAVDALIIRGIANLIDDRHEGDTQNFQALAARHASAFAFEVLAKLDP